ncbi:MAG: YbfB/YjiJ family MFS transporter [Betaproteobacteria bacterium]
MSPRSAQDRQALRIALTGLISLAVAMGLGRFAFTPILPMMLRDGWVDLNQASWLASSNYLGYLMGALACALQPWLWARLGLRADPALATLVRIGLVGTTVLTLAMVMPVPWAWLRWGAGLASALVFVYASGWCLSQLNRLGRPHWGGLIYAGPGAGIVISGLAVTPMIAQDWPATWAWLSMAALALVGTGLAWPSLVGHQAHLERLMPVDAGAGPAARGPSRWLELTLTTLGYGLAGFGYLISATFLPVIARQSLPESVWLDLFWPLFGIGVVVGALLSTRLAASHDKRLLLCAGFLIQAAALTIGLISPTVPGFVVSSFFLGLPFTAMSFFAMQEARRLSGGTAASFMGLLTATYGLGQVLGPLLVGWLLNLTGAKEGFDLALTLAGVALLSGGAFFGFLRYRYPVVSLG